MSVGYLLDTHILIAARKGEPVALLNRLAGLTPGRLGLSSIVLAELLTGAEKSRDATRNTGAIQAMTQGMELLPFEADDATAFARIRCGLENVGSPIGPYELLIAAQAVSRGLTLVTANEKEFRRVPGLKCENWLK